MLRPLSKHGTRHCTQGCCQERATDTQRQTGQARSMSRRIFHGWRVVGSAFVVAVFGWGVGFYGPPVFLSAVQSARGWPLALVSAAVTTHFLVGALTGANLPAIHRRLGL